MKYTTIAVALLFCMLLTGCGGEDSNADTDSSVTEITTSAVTSADGISEDTAESKNTMNTEKTTATRDRSDSPESDKALEDSGSYSDDADIEIGDDTPAVTTAKTSDNTNTVTTAKQTEKKETSTATKKSETEKATTSKAAETTKSTTAETQKPTGATTKATETEPNTEGGNVLPDDGLDWSPLVPVN